MIQELSSLIVSLWEVQPVYRERHTFNKEVKQMQLELVTVEYRFSPMHRSFIPKPNKRFNKFRPITQLIIFKDRLVLDALERIPMDPIFSKHSHGFRPRRGTISFIKAVREWPTLDRMIQCDIVKCFDRIDHELLLSFLRAKLGSGLVDLITAFRIVNKGPYRWPKTKVLSPATEQGIPQGSPISPVLMNCFLHHLDIEMEQQGRLFFYFI